MFEFNDNFKSSTATQSKKLLSKNLALNTENKKTIPISWCSKPFC